MLLDLGRIERLITPATRALMPSLDPPVRAPSTWSGDGHCPAPTNLTMIERLARPAAPAGGSGLGQAGAMRCFQRLPTKNLAVPATAVLSLPHGALAQTHSASWPLPTACRRRYLPHRAGDNSRLRWPCSGPRTQRQACPYLQALDRAQDQLAASYRR